MDNLENTNIQYGIVLEETASFLTQGWHGNYMEAGVAFQSQIPHTAK